MKQKISDLLILIVLLVPCILIIRYFAEVLKNPVGVVLVVLAIVIVIILTSLCDAGA